MKALLASILAATLSSVAHSAIISFPNNPVIPPSDDFRIATNFVDTGFRFSPRCHLDFLYTMDCRGDVQNENPITDPSFDVCCGWLYVDAFGKPFSLVSMLPAEDFQDVELHNVDVYSSKGGFFRFWDHEDEKFFTGDEWRDITWLAIVNDWGNSPAQGITNFVVSIPEPAPLPLIGIALAGLAFIRRRKQ